MSKYLYALMCFVFLANQAEAKLCLKKSNMLEDILFCAETNHIPSQVRLASVYYFGLGVPKNIDQAKFWAEKAAANESAEGMYQLGHFYYYGHGVPPSMSKAMDLWKRASDLGYPNAMCDYAHRLTTGETGTIDYKQAFDILNAAIKKTDHPPSCVYILSKFYVFGCGTPQNIKKAKEILMPLSKSQQEDVRNTAGEFLDFIERESGMINGNCDI